MHIRNWSIGCAALALAACSGEAGEVAAAAEETSLEAPATDVAVSGEERRILAFGNSLFAGYGLSETEGYPEKLEAALRGEGINARVIDAGVSGDTSAAGRQRLGFTLDAQQTPPDLVLLELGGNDLIRGLSPDETRANFEAMLGELQSRGIPVLIMGMRAPPNYGPEFQQSFDNLYGELAREFDTPLVPFWLESIYEDPSLFQSDRIHPTAPGIEALVADTLDDVQAALRQAE